jgi:hypothetical protein
LPGLCLAKGCVLGEVQGRVLDALADGHVDDAELESIIAAAQNNHLLAREFFDKCCAMRETRRSRPQAVK